MALIILKNLGGNEMEDKILEVKDVDVEKEANKIALQVKNSPEVIALAQQLQVNDAQSIMGFGKETAVEISNFSDKILSTISSSSVEDSGKMLQQLNSIMKKFDTKDFEGKEPGFLEKLVSKVTNNLDKLLDKYQTVDKEISKIFIEIRQYESEINKTNLMLDEMFEKNLNYYRELEKYIEAGKIVVDKVKGEYLPELEKKAAASGEQMDQISLQNARQALEMMEQRIYDLEMAKVVSLQTAPQIKMIQKGNYNLVRKIGSAFIVTIPIFKSGLIQAVALKRQKIQAEAMKALDDTTNEMLLKNAQNIATQSVEIEKLSGSSSLKIETLEQTFQAILKGIEETKQIQVENQQKREEGKKKLIELQAKLKSTK